MQIGIEQVLTHESWTPCSILHLLLLSIFFKFNLCIFFFRQAVGNIRFIPLFCYRFLCIFYSACSKMVSMQWRRCWWRELDVWKRGGARDHAQQKTGNDKQLPHRLEHMPLYNCLPRTLRSLRSQNPNPRSILCRVGSIYLLPTSDLLLMLW